MTQRVLILGGAGMLGHKLCQLYRREFDTWCTVRSMPRGPDGFEIWDKEKTITGVDEFMKTALFVKGVVWVALTIWESVMLFSSLPIPFRKSC